LVLDFFLRERKKKENTHTDLRLKKGDEAKQ
jgi:hypothetical protein